MDSYRSCNLIIKVSYFTSRVGFFRTTPRTPTFQCHRVTTSGLRPSSLTTLFDPGLRRKDSWREEVTQECKNRSNCGRIELDPYVDRETLTVSILLRELKKKFIYTVLLNSFVRNDFWFLFLFILSFLFFPHYIFEYWVILITDQRQIEHVYLLRPLVMRPVRCSFMTKQVDCKEEGKFLYLEGGLTRRVILKRIKVCL